MRCCRFVLLLSFFVLSQTVLSAEPPLATLPAKEKFHLYLLIGQSNMAGRGEMDKNQTPPPRVLKFDKAEKWIPATDPLHFDKPAIAGVGPGSSFGPAMAATDESITVGLIPSAVGGTPLSRWVRGGDLYQQALARAKHAAAVGTIRGVIWHQGEADSGNEQLANSYGERLAGMIAAFREDLQIPDLPFVVGKLGDFVPPEKAGFRNVVNSALAQIPLKVKNCACVEASGLKAKSDGIHFDAESSREFGRRYAKAMIELQAAKK